MRRAGALAACLMLAGCAGLFSGWGTVPSTPQPEQDFADVRKWSQVLDDPARDAWQKPQEVIKALALKSDAVVADIGAGTGYFSVRLSGAVPRGRIYGIDIEPGMVTHLAERVRLAGLRNVIPMSGKATDPTLPEKADLVLMVGVYPYLRDRQAYFRKLRYAMNPGGRVAIVDYREDAPVGPPAGTRVSSERIRLELEAAGYTFEREHDFLPHQHYQVFRRAEP